MTETLAKKNGLVREPICIDGMPDANFEELCAQNLQYWPGGNQYRRAAKRAFDSLAFAPLKQEAVDNYKWWKSVDIRYIYAMSCLLASFIVFVVSIGLTRDFGQWLCVAGIMCSCVLVMLAVFCFCTNKGVPVWRLVKLYEYTGKVPRFVLQTAIDVKEALLKQNCQCEFWVDYLAYDKTPAGDPFLVVSVGEERFWLEVWQEDGFDVQRDI